jgi:hypothetical protein
VIANSVSEPIWLDFDRVLHGISVATPSIPPLIVAGSSTGYTGTVTARYSNIIKDSNGNLLAESSLSPVSESLTLANQDISYTIPISADSTITGRRLYRTATLGTSYFFLTDIDDNTTTTWLNADADAALSIEAVSSGDLVKAPSRLKFVVAWKNRLWGVSAQDIDTIYGSVIDAPSSWPTSFSVPPAGADEYGITGFLPRRDELGIAKRGVIYKLVGDEEANFRLVKLYEGVGCMSPDTCVVIRDQAFWLGADGVYQWDIEGMRSITDETVRPWFTTDTYFARATFANSFAAYDPRTFSYVLFLCSAGSTTIDRWVTYDLTRKKWFGPHKTAAFTPTCAAALPDTNGIPRLMVGATNGYVHIFTADNYYDGTGTATAIDFDTYGKFHSGGEPDLTHLWLQPTMLTKVDTAGTLTVTPYVGALNASAGTAQSVALTSERTRLARLGVGRLCQLRLRQETAGQGVEVYGFELPYAVLGRR